MMRQGYVVAVIGAVLAWAQPMARAQEACTAKVYLTLDTGNMSHAQVIAEILKKHAVAATFFLANERTLRGDYALDDSWAPYWKARFADGHAFGTHTWRHGRLLRDTDEGGIQYRPQFGENKGRTLTLSSQEFCAELQQVDKAFGRLTGQPLDALWRAPGGYITPQSLRAARDCGYSHVHWAPAGFLGDELPSEKFSNGALLQQALHTVRDGDVLMAHLGIWSRKAPFAPMLEPLITGLKERGFCFSRLTDHPDYVASGAAQGPLPMFLRTSQRSSGTVLSRTESK